MLIRGRLSNFFAHKITKLLSSSIVFFLILIILFSFNNIIFLNKSQDTYAKLCPEFKEILINYSSIKLIHNERNLPQLTQFNILFNTIYINGSLKKTKDHLTIGIPSIKRIVGSTYLLKTLEYLILRTSPMQQMISTVLVYLCDLDETYNSEVIKEIYKTFQEYIDNGFIVIMRVNILFYPDFKSLKRNFNDSPERVAFRTKQIFDYALMFSFALNLSDYYLQVEDDIECKHNYFEEINEFIQKKANEKWVMLEFSELGFIGKLFKSHDLIHLIQFLITFYDEQPVDWLITYFRLVSTQREIYLKKPTLFQHFGIKSSFDIRTDNNLKDRYYENYNKPWDGDNPPALLITNMTHTNNYHLNEAYGNTNNYFWATNVYYGSKFVIIFKVAQNISKIMIETGDSDHPLDILENATISICSNFKYINKITNNFDCIDPIVLGEFYNGSAYIDIHSFNEQRKLEDFYFSDFEKIQNNENNFKNTNTRTNSNISLEPLEFSYFNKYMDKDSLKNNFHKKNAFPKLKTLLKFNNSNFISNVNITKDNTNLLNNMKQLKNKPKNVGLNVMCLVLESKLNHSHWVIVRQIAVFLKK